MNELLSQAQETVEEREAVPHPTGHRTTPEHSGPKRQSGEKGDLRLDRPWWVLAVALTTLGSGLINLYSLIGPDLPNRVHLLREFFPLEFLHLSRFLTYLTGFALILSSINIYRRKKRAFQLVLALSCLSVVFHLTKGLDYEEALYSLALLLVLLETRKHFTVRSSPPEWRGQLGRLGLGFLIALTYGVTGLWLLERRQFGIDFTLRDSVHTTLQYLILVGDASLVPHTRYAAWFLDSLYLATITAIGYAGWALFRPVLFEYSTLPHERSLAREVVQRYGRSALDYFKTWDDKSFLFSLSERSFLAYGVSGNFALVLGDPVGPEEEREELIRSFALLCYENGWTLAFHSVLPDDLPLYRRLGFHKLKIGDEAIVELAQFGLEGKSKKELRSKVNLLEKQGYRMVCYDPPLSDELLAQAREVSDEWLQIPGRRERQFSLGYFDPGYLRSLPLYALVDGADRMLAFANIIPSYRPGECTVDLMRRRNQAPNGIMEYLFTKMIADTRAKGFRRFDLGLAPMAGFQEREQASPEERAVHFFFQHLNFLFSYRGLYHFKRKFATLWEPRYVIYRNVFDLPRLARALSRLSEMQQ